MMNANGSRLGVAASCVAALAGSIAAQGATRADAVEFFERRIRPVLAQECYECHSSRGKHGGGLALDHRAALLAGGDSGLAIVPGDPAASRLLAAIRHSDPKLKMPKARPRLTAAVIDDFTTWIRDGAADPRDAPPTAAELAADTDWPAVMRRRLDWWSFRPIRPPDLDALPVTGGRAHAVDRLIDARLAAAGLSPAPRATRTVLARRLSFALRGLPPTADEVDAFAHAAADDERAFADLVDTWLASPRFGERWARHWMDWLRYADSHGSEGDPLIPYAWRYRDYLIRALNDDVPYDQLVREHLAGDLLPAPRIDAATGIDESALGTAHLRMVFHGYAPTDALAEKMRFTDDQIDVVSKAFLGLTVACARCHDHKFDPISQQDYTALYGIFASCTPATIAVDAPAGATRQVRAALQTAKSRLRHALGAVWIEGADALEQRLLRPDAALHTAMTKATTPTDVLHAFQVLHLGATPPAPLADWRRGLHASGATPVSRDLVHWDLAQPRGAERWRRSGDGTGTPAPAGAFALAADGPDVLLGIYPGGTYSHLLTTKDRGVVLSPHVELTEPVDLWLLVAGDGGAAARYVVQDYPRDGSVFPVAALAGGQWRWIHFDLRYWQGDRIHVELATAADQPVLADPRTTSSWFGVRRVRLLAAGAPAPATACEFAAPLLATFGDREPATAAELAAGHARALRTCAAAWATGTATDAQALYLDELRRAGLLQNQVSALPGLAALIADCRRLLAALPVPTRAPGVLEMEPVDAPLLSRGNSKQPGAPVARRGLSALGGAPSPADASGRRELAEDFLRADNPLLARVFVNRVWHHLFGRGLVATPDNFGHLGQEPSHPELLDYLAHWFVAHHYSIKALVRLLVTSATWQATSTPAEAARQRDPDDVLLSHFPLRRLEAEAIRDSLLAVAGDLQLEPMSGPAVTGRTPRRSVYVRVQRNDLDPMLTAFDAPVPASARGRRDVTNVPAQSLTLLNDPFVHDLAEHWAARLDEEPDLRRPASRVDAMFAAAFGRAPTAAERDRALAYVQQGAARHAEAAASDRTPPPAPVCAWDFGRGSGDVAGGLHTELHGNARIADAALALDGAQSFVATAPLPFELSAKTLTAWVQLENLSQRGGGVISVQTLDGVVFDAIVFGERQARRWLPGSDHFRRTQDLGGGAETEADVHPVHIAMVYASDGTVTAYRNGAVVGKAYRTTPVTFAAGTAQVLLGNRHGEPGGNKNLCGRIHYAALYDRALTAAEVAADAAAAGDLLSPEDLLAALTPGERQQRDLLLAERARIAAALRSADARPGTASAWADLALALFNAKEFVYVR